MISYRKEENTRNIFNELRKDSRVYLTNTSKFKANSFHEKVNVILSGISNTKIVNTKFDNNSGASILINSTKGAEIKIESLEVTKSSGNQILIGINDTCYVKLQESIFNSIDGNIIHFNSSSTSNLILIFENSIFTESKSSSSLIIIDRKINLSVESEFKGLYFSNNENTIINFYTGCLVIYNCSFENHNGDTYMISMENFIKLTIKNSKFKNSSSGIISFKNSQTIITTDCYFSLIDGVILNIENSKFTDINSTFELNKKSIIVCENCENCTLNNSLFSKNNLNFKTMIRGQSSSILIYKTVIEENFISDGYLYSCEDRCLFEIRDSFFQYNTGGLFIDKSLTKNLIHNTIFKNNENMDSFLIKIFNSQLNIEKSEFSKNKISISILISGNSHLIMRNIKIYEEILGDAFLEIESGSNVQIIESQIYFLKLYASNNLIRSSGSTLLIQNCEVFDNRIENGRLISSSFS